MISHVAARFLKAVHLEAMILPISEIVWKAAPTYYYKHRWSTLRNSYRERELYVAPFLCNPNKISIDVGASEGLYTLHVLQTSRECLAFEPHPTAALKLSGMAKSFSLPVRVEAVALSEKEGEETLRIYKGGIKRSTIERENDLADCDSRNMYEVTVPTRQLDDYDLDAVGFLKIDVEGHELSVLKGASNTIEHHRPLMLIEIEDRHKPKATRDVQDFLGNLGYEGYFLLDGKLIPMTCFALDAYQGNCTSGYYVNNFFFVMPEDIHILESAVFRVRENL